MTAEESITVRDRLVGCPLLEGLSPDEAQRLIALGEVRRFADGETVVHHGDNGADELMIVLTGRCEVRNSMNDLITVLESGALLGEVGFLDRRGRSANAHASGNAEVLAFGEDLLDKLDEDPRLQTRLLLNLARVLCQKLRSTTRLVEASFF